MSDEKLISYQFKGHRTYVPGVDIYDSMLEMSLHFLGKYPTALSGSFHRLITHQALFRILEEKEVVEMEKIHAHFLIKTPNRTYQITVSQTGEPISSSYDYDETQVTDVITWGHQTAQIKVKPGYSYMEQLVAITKKLHQKHYKQAEGQWLFTKIQISDVIDPDRFQGRKLVVKAGKNLHNRLTQNLIFLDDNLLGDIWFSLVAKEEKK
jgi:hypothetical protein